MKIISTAYLKNFIRNFGYSQDMVLPALFVMLVLILSGCQTQSDNMADVQNEALSAVMEEALDTEMADETTDLNIADDEEESLTPKASELIFTEGLGYKISWPLEERFIISPPQHLRSLMIKTCQDTGYITPYINTIKFEDDGIKAYFLCRGFGG